MISLRLHTAAALPLVLASASLAQTAPPQAKPAPKPAVPYMNHNLIFLDPSHGGIDSGAHLPNQVLEKDVTLALAGRIRGLLAANGIGVLLSREADAPASADADEPAAAAAVITPDQRAGAANHVHPVACILLHATNSGNGVHVITSALPPPEILPDGLPATPYRAVPWESAQTDSVVQSQRLATEIATAITRANVPVHLSRGSVRPIDSLTCPAAAIEIAPLPSGATPVSDAAYQQRVAQAVATALLFWRGHADPPLPPRPADPAAGAASAGAQP